MVYCTQEVNQENPFFCNGCDSNKIINQSDTISMSNGCYGYTW